MTHTQTPSPDPAAGPGRAATLRRRTLLEGALAVPALLAVSALVGPARAGEDEGEDDPGRAAEVAALLESWRERATAAVEAGDTDDEALLHALLADVARFDPRAFPPRARVAYSDDAFTSGPILASPAFLVLEFEMRPGTRIEPHNHVGWSFVSVGVEGEATVRHFEPADATFPDPGRELDVPFTLREVQRTVLTRGRSSSLTRTRANIHAFAAGSDGARFLDFGVNYVEPRGGYESFSKLAIDEAPLDAARGLHRGRWIGNPKD